MIHTRGASDDAASTSAKSFADETVLWLRPRAAAHNTWTDNASAGHLFLRLSATLSLGAILTFASVGAAVAPATAHPNELVAAPVSQESSITVDLPSEIAGLTGLSASDRQPIEIAVADLPVEAGIDIAVVPVVVAPIPFTTTISFAGPEERSTEPVVDLAGAGPGFELVTLEDRPPPDLNELLSFDGRRVPRWIVETILQAADTTGVDPAYLMALADKESSFMPAVKASTSSAEGLFQFLTGTWLEMIQAYGPKYGLLDEAAAVETINGQLTIADEGMRTHVLGLRRDSYLAALMAAEMMKRDRARVERRIGRPITRSEFYLAHFFGVNSASRFMELLNDKPKQSAPRVFPAAAKANKALFFAKEGRKTRHLTVAEVYDKLDTMIDQRIERYEGVKVIVSAELSL